MSQPSYSLESTLEAVANIFSEIIEEVKNSQKLFDVKASDLTGLMYHYTDVGGLYGVISGQSVWCSNILYMNDSSEFHHGAAVARHIIYELMEGKDDHLSRKMFEIASYSAEAGMLGWFISCFTKNGDLLSQWRGYTPNGGYSVGIDIQEFYAQLDPSVYNLEKVYYNHEDQNKTLDYIIQSFYARVKGRLLAAQVDDYAESIASEFINSLIYYYLLMKNDGFQEEDEIRLLTFTLDPQIVSVRPVANFIKPYVPVRFERLPIKEIIVGPTVDFIKSKYGIETLLEKQGYSLSDIKIIKSKIPYCG